MNDRYSRASALLEEIQAGHRELTKAELASKFVIESQQEVTAEFFMDLPHPAWIKLYYNDAFHMFYTNTAYKHLIDIDLTEYFGKQDSEVFEQDDFDKADRLVYETGEPFRGTEFWLKKGSTKGDKPIGGVVQKWPLYDKNRKIIGVCGEVLEFIYD